MINGDGFQDDRFIEAVARMQLYIEEHIKEPITQTQLAKAAGYSPYHCARMFKDLTGKTPFEYIRSLRLSQGALKLCNEKVKVIDIALEYVFDSHEGFTRAFFKEFGITPKKYSKDPKPLNLFTPSIVKKYHLQNTCKKGCSTMNAIFVQIMDRPARKLILKRAKKAADYFEYCEETGCDVWGILCNIKNALYEPVGMWMPDSFRPVGTSYYTQGVEVPADYSGEIPAGFEIIDLPPCKMMIFQGPPFEDENFSDAIGDLWEQIKNFNPQIYGYEWADQDAPEIQLEPMGYRGYIEGRPVKPINKPAV